MKQRVEVMGLQEARVQWKDVAIQFDRNAGRYPGNHAVELSPSGDGDKGAARTAASRTATAASSSTAEVERVDIAKSKKKKGTKKGDSDALMKR